MKAPLPQNNPWVKYLFRLACVVFISLFLIYLCVKFWIGPKYTQKALVEDISSFWDGQVEISGIDFRFFRPITIERIQLINQMEEKSVELKGTTLICEKWPSINPQLNEIAIDSLDLKLDMETDGSNLTFQKKSSSSATNEPSTPLEKITVDHISIHVLSANETVLTLNDLSFTAINAMPDDYSIILKQASSAAKESLSVTGTINSQNSKASLMLLLDKHIDNKTGKAILSLFNIPQSYGFEGDVSAEILLIGTLPDIAQIQPKGSITLKNFRVSQNDNIWMENLNSKIKVDDTGLHAPLVQARSFGGVIESNLDAKVKENQLIQLTGQIDGKDMQVAEIIELTDAKASSGGELEFNYRFTADHNLQNMTGTGELFLEQVDFNILPIVQKIMNTVLLRGFESHDKVNAHIPFEIDTPAVIFQQGRVANDWIAIESLPGANLDLPTAYFDGNFVVAPIKQIRETLQKVPVVELFVNIKDKLIHLHVKGSYFDSSKFQVKIQPLDSISQETLHFFRDVESAGAGFIKGVKDTSEGLMKRKE